MFRGIEYQVGGEGGGEEITVARKQKQKTEEYIETDEIFVNCHSLLEMERYKILSAFKHWQQLHGKVFSDVSKKLRPGESSLRSCSFMNSVTLFHPAPNDLDLRSTLPWL